MLVLVIYFFGQSMCMKIVILDFVHIYMTITPRIAATLRQDQIPTRDGFLNLVCFMKPVFIQFFCRSVWALAASFQVYTMNCCDL